jgi:3',5'-cyclic AMP phosphodiesterase CpdA
MVLRKSSTSKPPDPFEPTPILHLIFRAPVKLFLYHIYHLTTSLRSTPTPAESPIRVVCISDTHDQFPDHVPDGDILIHAGDLTNDGSVEGIQRQVDWLAGLPHREVIVISGNHDTYLDPRTRSKLTAFVNWKRVRSVEPPVVRSMC